MIGFFKLIGRFFAVISGLEADREREKRIAEAGGKTMDDLITEAEERARKARAYWKHHRQCWDRLSDMGREQLERIRSGNA